MCKKEKKFHDFVYNEYTSTIRNKPENYWIATVQPDRSLKFDSWDKAIVGRFRRLEVIIKWKLNIIKKQPKR